MKKKVHIETNTVPEDLNYLDALPQDVFNYLTTFIPYNKGLKALSQVSKNVNTQVGSCPGGRLAEDIIVHTKKIGQSITPSFFGKHIFTLEKLAPWLVIFACAYLLSQRDNPVDHKLTDICSSMLGGFLFVAIMNLLLEVNHFSSFKERRVKVINQLMESLDKPKDFSYRK